MGTGPWGPGCSTWAPCFLSLPEVLGLVPCPGSPKHRVHCSGDPVQANVPLAVSDCFLSELPLWAHACVSGTELGVGVLITRCALGCEGASGERFAPQTKGCSPHFVNCGACCRLGRCPKPGCLLELHGEADTATVDQSVLSDLCMMLSPLRRKSPRVCRITTDGLSTSSLNSMKPDWPIKRK